MSAGRLKRSQWIERWGVDVAKKLHAKIAEGFDLFRALSVGQPAARGVLAVKPL